MNTPNNDAPALPPLPEAHTDPRSTWTPYSGSDMEAYARAAVLADRASVADRGVRAVPGEPVAWLRDQRGEYEGRETLDPLFILGSCRPTSRYGATYSPLAAFVASPAAPASTSVALAAPEQVPPRYSREYVADMEDTLKQIADALGCPPDADKIIAAAAKAVAAPEANGEPFGWLYETKAGVRVFHKAGDCSEKLLAYDKQAAVDYPSGHSITPVYVAPSVLPAQEANGPGTPAYRFERLMDELEKRFPDPAPHSASLPEPRILALLDARLAATPAPAVKVPAEALEKLLSVIDDVSNSHVRNKVRAAVMEFIRPAPAASAQPQAPQGEAVGNWKHFLAGIVDIYFDGVEYAPEDRCYVEGSLDQVMDEARKVLAADEAAIAAPPSSTAPAAPQATAASAQALGEAGEVAK